MPAQLSATYRREITSRDTTDSDLFGTWTLELRECQYRIAVDGSEQGSGRLEVVREGAQNMRVALSDDPGCPNEFTGEALYDFTFDGRELQIDEAIAGVDLCEGRAVAFTGTPTWRR